MAAVLRLEVVGLAVRGRAVVGLVGLAAGRAVTAGAFARAFVRELAFVDADEVSSVVQQANKVQITIYLSLCLCHSIDV